MNYEVKLRRAAQKELDAISGRDYEIVARAISGLGQSPRPKRTKKLAEGVLWRIRMGHYRIVYAIDDKARFVIVVRVARRTEDTYKRL